MDINELLIRSAKLDEQLAPLFQLKPFNNSERLTSSRIMCSVAFEHAESAKMLSSMGNFTSAIGLLRLQYEALVRSYWLMYAASDLAVNKLMTELNNESAAKADKLPMLSEMLKNLHGKAPKVAMDQLIEFKEYSWKPLSSYIHGGIHALNRHSKGYPVPLLLQLVRASNGLSLMGGMLLVMLTGDENNTGKMSSIQQEFLDCLPDLKNQNQ